MKRLFPTHILLMMLIMGLSKMVSAEPVSGTVVVIVNHEFPHDSVSSAELADYFSGATPFLPNRARVQPVMAPPEIDEVNTRFLHVILRTTQRDFRHDWEARVYRGETTLRPIQARSVVEAARAVIYHPNTMAMIDSASLSTLPTEFSRGYKILKIDGTAPEDSLYPIR